MRLKYDTNRVWYLLDKVKDKWNGAFSGSPSYYDVWLYIKDDLYTSDHTLYKKLYDQIEYNREYEYEHFDELR